MWDQAGRPPSGTRPREGEVMGAFPDGKRIKRYDVPTPMQGATGEIEAFALHAGQSVGLVQDIPPVSAIMVELSKGFFGQAGRSAASGISTDLCGRKRAKCVNICRFPAETAPAARGLYRSTGQTLRSAVVHLAIRSLGWLLRKTTPQGLIF